jgi:hypothetical protein
MELLERRSKQLPVIGGYLENSKGFLLFFSLLNL